MARTPQGGKTAKNNPMINGTRKDEMARGNSNAALARISVVAVLTRGTMDNDVRPKSTTPNPDRAIAMPKRGSKPRKTEIVAPPKPTKEIKADAMAKARKCPRSTRSPMGIEPSRCADAWQATSMPMISGVASKATAATSGTATNAV